MAKTPKERYTSDLSTYKFQIGTNSGAATAIAKDDLLVVQDVSETTAENQVKVARAEDVVGDVLSALGITGDITVLDEDSNPLILTLTGGVITAATSSFGGGTGVLGDPYIVETAGQMNLVRYYLDSYFELGNSINMSSYANWEPIGQNGVEFTGNFDGGGYTLSNLTSDTTGQSKDGGLFGTILGATITDLDIATADVTADLHTGICLGEARGVCTLTGITVAGSVETVATGHNVGGLVGYVAAASTISDCHADATVTGVSNAGGLIGAMTTAQVSECSNKGAVSTSGTTGYYVGGLVGKITSTGDLTDCYNQGNVAATNVGAVAGGAVGNITLATGTSALTNCYSTAILSGSGTLNAFLGSKTVIPAGLVVIVSSYYNSTIAGTATDTAGTTGAAVGAVTADMKQAATFVDWDFAVTPIWAVVAGVSYPTLICEV